MLTDFAGVSDFEGLDSKADVLPFRRSRNCREKFSREVSIHPNGEEEMEEMLETGEFRGNAQTVGFC